MTTSLPMRNFQLPEKLSPKDYDEALDIVDVWDTIQGEGPFAGYPAIFVRLAGCNLQCPLCDTDYTSNRRVIKTDDLIQTIRGFPKDRIIVVTGGEPFRQAGLVNLVNPLTFQDRIVQIETNGTMGNPYLNTDTKYLHIVCSPKTGKVHTSLLAKIKYYKYVLAAGKTCPNDGLPTEILGNPIYVARPGLKKGIKVYCQPEDTLFEGQNKINLDHTVEVCMKFNYIFSLQVHKYIGVK